MRPRGGLGRTDLPRAHVASLAIALALVACAPITPGPTGGPTPSVTPSTTGSSRPAAGQIVPAPGSASRLFAPNPGAIVVAIDPGHGGCLDWGVPNPYDNTVERS